MSDPNDPIQEYWYALDWDVEALWKLVLPVEHLPLAALSWHFDVPLWADNGVGYQVTPRQVMNDPAAHPEEHARMERADLAYPVEVIFYKDRWMILDGVHRLLKARVFGQTEIAIRKVPIEAVRQLRRWPAT